MGIQGTGVYTGTLSGTSLTITAAMGVYFCALLYQSGTVTIQGSYALGGAASTAIALSSSNPSITVGGTNSSLDGFTINAASGIVQIVCYF